MSKEEGTAFVPMPPGVDLSRVFSIQHDRIVSNDNTVSYKAQTFQLPESTLRYSFAKCRVTVYEHLDGTTSIGYGAHTIAVYEPDRTLRETPVSPMKKAA